MYAEAGLRDAISVGQADMLGKQVRILRRALQQEFSGQVRLRLMNPWTPEGLWFAIRNRLREFPVILVGRQRFPLETPLETLLEAVRSQL